MKKSHSSQPDSENSSQQNDRSLSALLKFASTQPQNMIDELFPPEFTGEHFEERCKENGFTYWMAADLMVLLGYESATTFAKAISKAMVTCNTLGIPIFENIIQIETTVDGKQAIDYKLSRFACYLTVMNADGKKPAVARAQAYFATLAGAVDSYLDQVDKVERVIVRDEVTEGEKSLSGVAHKAGVQNYGFFQNAGYRGMYNKNMKDLKTIRGVPENRTLLDFMGKTELAANLFRITQTEEKIKQENIYGQNSLESAAKMVGQTVRSTMQKISGVVPENLPGGEDIKKVRANLKLTGKQMKSIDKKKK